MQHEDDQFLNRGASKTQDLVIGAALLGVLLVGLGLFLAMSDVPESSADESESGASNGAMRTVIENIGELAKQPAEVTSVAVSLDGKWIATGLSDGNVTVWESAPGKLLRSLTGHSGAVKGVAFSSEGKLISGGADGTIRVWDIHTGKSTAKWEVTGGAITCVAAYPFGPYVLAGCSDRTLRLCDPNRAKDLRRFEGLSAPATCVTFSPDARSFLSGSQDGRVQLWAITQSASVAKLAADQTAAMRGVALTSDGTVGISATDDGKLLVWDLQKRSLKESFAGPFGEETTLSSMTCSPGGTLAITGGSDQRLHLWKIASGYVGSSAALHEQAVTGCGLSPNGLFALSGSSDGAVHAWVLPKPSDVEIQNAKNMVENFHREGALRKQFAEQMQRGQKAAEAGRMEEARQAFQRAKDILPAGTIEHELAQSAMGELESEATRKRDEYVQHMEKGKKALEAGDDANARKEFLAAKSIAPQRAEADEGLAQIERSKELQKLLGSAKSDPKLNFDFQPTGDDLLKQGNHFAYLFDEDELAKAQKNASPFKVMAQEVPPPPMGLTSSPLVWTVTVTTSKPIPEPNLKVRLRLQDAEFKRVYAEQDYVLQQGTQVQNVVGRAPAPQGGWTSGRYAFRYFLVTASSERELGVPRRFAMGLLKWTSQSVRVTAPLVQKANSYTLPTGFSVIADEPFRVDAMGDIRPVSPRVFREIAGRDGVVSSGPEGLFPGPGSRGHLQYMAVSRELPFAALLFKMDSDPSTPWSRYQHRLSRGLSPRSGEMSLSINSVTAARQGSRFTDKFQTVPKTSPTYWQGNGEFQVQLHRGQFEFPVTLSPLQKMHLLKPFSK